MEEDKNKPTVSDSTTAETGDNIYAKPTTLDTTTDAEPDAPKPEPQPKSTAKKPRSKVRSLFALFGLIGFVLAIVAWWQYITGTVADAIIVAIISAVMSACGVSLGKGCIRDISLVALVASLTLLIVYAIFIWAIPYAINLI